MILAQPNDVVIERVETLCRQNPRLPERSAEHSAEPSGPGDLFGASGEHAANGATEAL